MSKNQVRSWLKYTSALVACCAVCALPGLAQAQVTPSLIPAAPTPAENVYSLLSQYSALSSLPIYRASQVTGQWTSMTVIGDSWADWGNGRWTTVYRSSQVGDDGRWGNALNIIDAKQYHWGLASSQVKNYAVGGATSAYVNNNNLAWNLPGMYWEVQSIINSGVRFGMSDLIDITSMGGNDGLLTAKNWGITFTDQDTARNNLYNIQQMVNLGGRNFLLHNAGNFQINQQTLAPLAQQGIRIFIFDGSTFVDRVKANPAAYGFKSSSDYCAMYGGTHSCAAANRDNPRMTNASLAEQNEYAFYYVHPTSAMAGYLAAYGANLADAPATINAQAEVAQIAVAGFSNNLLGRLDAYRRMGANATANAYASAMPTKAKPAAIQTQPWSVFLEGAYQTGKRGDSLFAFGYDYDIEGGTVGAQYQVNPNLSLGAAFSGTTSNSTLNFSQGHTDIDSYQFAAFASVNYPNWFVDAVGTVGRNNYKIDRVGVFGKQNADTDGTSYAFAAKAGYLFDVGAMKIGPIAGFNYTKVKIDGYTETGDSLINQVVADQDADSLSAQAGVQFRLAQPYGAAKLDPYVNVTAEHQFSGDRTILSWQENAPLLPVYTPIQNRGEITYGKVSLGMSAVVTDKLSAQISAVTTFARDGGDDYGVSGGFKYQF
ncbi:autotransporter domain-containing protein [Xanthobacteraceae bacterium Astr-EGSB]|uniref:autotransporter domain-containing protein n=1 Tax=Astrobacterium formosum TaxID=3069710 RepID=UPI0027B4C4C7|nr:autotransporter domain-containing protein [Xanthobacteraceae bacterium Astr-EGSB]